MDHMQVLMDTTGTTPDIGITAVSVGNFSKLLLDINSSYVENDLGAVKDARVAFRYLGTEAGVNGPNYASAIGIDSLAFVSK